jgi:hypothetical protein
MNRTKKNNIFLAMNFRELNHSGKGVFIESHPGIQFCEVLN